MIEPLCRSLEIARVDVTHIAEINQANQSFYGQVFLILRSRAGADDPDLTSEFEGFPFDEDGEPTFRPSAKWYNNQIHFPNAKNLKIIESKVTKEGRDLQLIQRVEATFFEKFELKHFPFDAQDLTVAVSCKCAMEGPVPVKFSIPAFPPPQLGVDTTNFNEDDIWDLSPNVLVTLTTVGACNSRRFPAIHLSVSVRRYSGFVMFNVAVPVSIISFLSLATYSLPPENIASRLDSCITLLLTAVAFKFATASCLPQVSYMTVIDKYNLLCALIIVLSILGHTMMGFMNMWFGISFDVLVLISNIFLGIILVAWIMVQIWLLRTESSLKHEKSFNQQKRRFSPSASGRLRSFLSSEA